MYHLKQRSYFATENCMVFLLSSRPNELSDLILLRCHFVHPFIFPDVQIALSLL